MMPAATSVQPGTRKVPSLPGNFGLIAWRVMIEKKISTVFSHDPDVDVKCKVTRGFLASQARTSAWMWVP
jgi:hypothetical protein